MDKSELELLKQRLRFAQIMRRHIREDDAGASDDAFVRTVFARYRQERDRALIDPAE